MITPRHIRRRPSLVLLLPCLLFAGSVAAGEVALHGPNSGSDSGECSHPSVVVPESANPKPVPTTPGKHRTRIKPVVSVRAGDGDDSGSSHAPRWHSFLPGMFR